MPAKGNLCFVQVPGYPWNTAEASGHESSVPAGAHEQSARTPKGAGDLGRDSECPLQLSALSQPADTVLTLRIPLRRAWRLSDGQRLRVWVKERPELQQGSTQPWSLEQGLPSQRPQRHSLLSRQLLHCSPPYS